MNDAFLLAQKMSRGDDDLEQELRLCWLKLKRKNLKLFGASARNRRTDYYRQIKVHEGRMISIEEADEPFENGLDDLLEARASVRLLYQRTAGSLARTLELLHTGHKASEIAQAEEVSRQTIYRRIKGLRDILSASERQAS